MTEVALVQPISLTWKGDRDDLNNSRTEWEVGWAFFSTGGFGHGLSNHYLANVASIRKPIVVLCPMLSTKDGSMQPTPFCIDKFPTHKPDEHWDVTVDLESLVVGQKPIITVNPSIHLVGIWHGWLQNGILRN